MSRSGLPRRASVVGGLSACSCPGCRTPDLPGTIRCTGCHFPRATGWFPRNGAGRRRARCRECLRPKRRLDKARRRQLVGVPEYVPDSFIAELMQRQGGLCACGCGRSIQYSFHVDHRVAIARGGRHARDNLQLLTPTCNLKKGKKG